MLAVYNPRDRAYPWNFWIASRYSGGSPYSIRSASPSTCTLAITGLPEGRLYDQFHHRLQQQCQPKRLLLRALWPAAPYGFLFHMRILAENVPRSGQPLEVILHLHEGTRSSFEDERGVESLTMITPRSWPRLSPGWSRPSPSSLTLAMIGKAL